MPPPRTKNRPKRYKAYLYKITSLHKQEKLNRDKDKEEKLNRETRQKESEKFAFQYLTGAKIGQKRKIEGYGNVQVMEKRSDGFVRVMLLDNKRKYLNHYAILNPNDEKCFKKGFRAAYERNYKLTLPQNKAKAEAAKMTRYECDRDSGNYCTVCKVDMGPQNYRQLCGKTHCLNSILYE